MLIHVVCFKYKAGVGDAERRDHRERLRNLVVIDGILELQAGEDLIGSARSYDTGLVVSFRDRAALDAYQKDPRHVPVAQLGRASCDHVVTVDFET
jgi:hypothetical protein